MSLFSLWMIWGTVTWDRDLWLGLKPAEERTADEQQTLTNLKNGRSKSNNDGRSRTEKISEQTFGVQPVEGIYG